MNSKYGFCLLTFLITIFFTQLIAQPTGVTFTVKGKITDESTGKPLEFATVALKRLKDSTLVSGTIASESGDFKLVDLPPGGYNIEIAFIGYERYNNKVFLRSQGGTPVNDLGEIKLKLSSTTLEGAEISAEKSFVINNIDKKTYDTQQLAVTTGGNVNDVLENIPSVAVDQDGNVSLRGNENVTILIDGRPSGLTGSGGKSLLESIPASAIEKVEVITNPSAKYDPDGISGIINIITKKNKLQGVTGNIGANTSFEGRFGVNGTLNYRKGKWNMYSNYAFTKDARTNSGYNYSEATTDTLISTREQDEEGSNNRHSNNIKIGTDYNINDNNTISASALLNLGQNESLNLVEYHTYDNISLDDSLYKRNTDGSSKNHNLDFDLAYKHYFKNKGQVLNIQGTTSFDNSDETNMYNQLGYINDETPEPVLPLYEQDHSKDKNRVSTFSADYEHPIGKDKKFETGYKGTFRNYDTDFHFDNMDPATGLYVDDITRSNQFIYQDQLHALYAQYRQSIKKFGYQLGVRSEYAQTQSELVTTNEEFNKDYFSTYPSAFVTYAPDDKSQIKTTYSRRINRPRKQQLNPFPEYDDPLNIRKGNPELDPEYTDSYELEYSRYIGKFSTTTTGYYRKTNDYIQRYRVVQPDGITVTTFENLAQSQNYGIELIVNGSPVKWWNLTLSSNLYWSQVDASNVETGLNSSGFSASGRIFTTFKLPYKTDLQFTYSYRAPAEVTQGKLKEMQMMNIAASKKVLKDKGVITLRLSDPFNVQKFGYEFESDTYYQDFSRKRQSRLLTVAFNYRFGELKDKDARPKKDQSPREDMDYDN